MRERNMIYGQREEKHYPLNSVMKASELLCQGYIGYWCYAINTQQKEEKAKDINVVCEFREVFLKTYWDCLAKRNWFWDWINP